MEYPYIEYKGKKFYEIGCRKCRKGGSWRIFRDEEKAISFLYKCGHCQTIADPNKMEENT